MTVVIFAFVLSGAELVGLELNQIALPLGLSLFVIVIGIRLWARSDRQIAVTEGHSSSIGLAGVLS